MDLDYCDVGWFALERNQDLSFIFEIASKCCISAAFVNYEGYPISSKRFLPTVVDIMVMWIKLPFTIQFSSLIPKVSVFPLPSAWPHSIYLDSWVSHSGSLCNIVLYSPGVYFHIQTQPQQEAYPLWPSLFILSGTISLLFSVAYWTYRSGEFILQCHIFLPFHTVHGVLTARILTWFAIPFSSGPHFLSELSAMTCPSCVALHGMTQSFIDLHKAVIHVMLLVSFLCLWFSFWRLWDYSSCFFCLPSDGWG